MPRNDRPRARCRTAARRLALLLVTAALAAAPSARGDEIVTKSGTKYEGRIVSEDGTHYVIETRDLGTLRIAKADVARAKSQDRDTAPGTKPGTPAPGGTPPSGQAPAGDGKAGNGGDEPAEKPVDPEEEARKKAEQEARDAAARLERRRAATLRRRTDPGADAGPTPIVSRQTEADREREQARERERETLGGAQLAATAPGTPVIVFEPPRPFPPAPSGIVLGRRSYARFDLGGTATASLTMTVADKTERLIVRLADVQRHVTAKADAARVRLVEGVNEGDWLRVHLSDGALVCGRFASVDDTHLHLRVPSADGAPSTEDVDVSKLVRVNGLLASPSVTRHLADLEPQEPVGIVTWPDGAEVIGRFCDRMKHHVRIDTTGDGEPDTLVPVIAPIAEVRRIPPQWRQTARGLTTGAIVRVRGYEEYPDARVERVFVAPLAGVTAFAIAVRLDDGCAIVPFDALVSFEPASEAEAAAAMRHVGVSAADLPLVPGTKTPDLQGTDLPRGISYVTDGHMVTHVYVAAPYDRTVCGLRVGMSAAEAVPYSDMHFGTEVIPKSDGQDRPRELISESVDGIRVTAYVDAKGNVSALELSRR